MKIDKAYILPFPPDRVYAAWVSPDDPIPPATRIEINLTVGGHIRQFIETEDRCNRAEGLFFCVEPDRHIRYTWERDRDGEITDVDVEFGTSDDGTALRIRQAGFRSEVSRRQRADEWDAYVERLTAVLEKSTELETA
ncbi:MAG: SRPBCC domain-containing protein [Pseudomonadota bacterium]